MLVLTRRINEEIVIGNDTVVKVVRVKGGSIRIGIEAPRNVKVMRSELSAAQREKLEGSLTVEETADADCAVETEETAAVCS